ncbi:UDP-N-acetyl-D-mannosamine dehydrogenase [Lonepinella sp. BR2474]|uniref:UDP-N-acetyl-D-mannosamine dehydrogenase n=1 Tax=Lonepinella sp. BR2474 TaxID=3434548 RepID=UPI003F6E0F8E
MTKQISVIGLGYIGLPTAVILANLGHIVYGMDTDMSKICAIQRAEITSTEPELANALKSAVQSGRLFASLDVKKADIFLIAVPTPLKADLTADLSYLQQAIQQIARQLQKGNLVVIESTVPVGTTEQVAQWLQELRPDLSFPLLSQNTADVQIAYCPERVLPSKMMQELVQNDRVIGGLSPACTQRAVDFYQDFVRGKCLATNAKTAEMCKLTENSFRDVNIAFANELSLICDQQGIDVWELINLANHHPRVDILQPGVGVGGHCIAVDPYFICSQSPEQAKLIHTAREVNNHKPVWVVEKIKVAVADLMMAKNCRPDEIKIACLGLSFKADVDDLRESPALAITQALAQWHQGEIWAVEPHIQTFPVSLTDQVKLTDFSTALQQADIIVHLVKHSCFATIKPNSTQVYLDFCGATV